jgi:ubiquinone biosynthesis protein UbiJ
MEIENKYEAALDMLEPEMAELLTEFLGKIRGKTIGEMMPVLAEFKGRLPKDRVFTEEERSLIVEEALSAMPEEEKNRYKTFLKMMKII